MTFVGSRFLEASVSHKRNYSHLYYNMVYESLTFYFQLSNVKKRILNRLKQALILYFLSVSYNNFITKCVNCYSKSRLDNFNFFGHLFLSVSNAQEVVNFICNAVTVQNTQLQARLLKKQHFTEF